jgi:hypothetical protein
MFHAARHIRHVGVVVHTVRSIVDVSDRSATFAMVVLPVILA